MPFETCLRIMDTANMGIILSRRRITKMLVRLHRMHRLISVFVVRIWIKQVLS